MPSPVSMFCVVYVQVEARRNRPGSNIYRRVCVVRTHNFSVVVRLFVSCMIGTFAGLVFSVSVSLPFCFMMKEG